MKKHSAYDQEEFKEDYLRILPPGTETNTNLYGELIVSIGELAWLKTAFPPENTKIRVKFWGQNGAGRVAVAKNAQEELHNLYSTELSYEIRCPILLFSKYLKDMVKLKVDILDKRNDKVVGIVIINMLLFLKSNPKADNNPIEDIKGLFPILQAQKYCTTKPVDITQKIGDIEIEIVAKFSKYPISTALNKLQDKTKQHLDSSFLLNEMKSHGEGGDIIPGQEQGIIPLQVKEVDLRANAKQRIAEAQQQYSQKQTKAAEENIKNNEFNQGKVQQNVRIIQDQAIDEEGSNEKLQKMLKEKQNEQYLQLLKKQELQLEQSMMHDQPILAPDLELMKLRMDEAELIDGLQFNAYSDLTNLPENMPDQEHLDLKSVTGYAVQVESFVLTNQIFKRKLQQAPVFLVIQLPSFEFDENTVLQKPSQPAGPSPSSGNKVFYDQLLVACRKQLALEELTLEFRQSFPCKLNLSETNISDFTDARVFFIIQIGASDDPNRIEFARGSFRFDQLLLKPYLRGTFEIPLFTTPSFSLTGKTALARKGSKVLTSKDETQVANGTPVGELNISVALLNQLSQYASDKLPIAKKNKNKSKKLVQNKTPEIPATITEIQFQIFLRVSTLSEISRVTPGTSLLVRHKIYGRNETLEGSMISIDTQNSSAIFNYQTIMPVEHQAIYRMISAPFILEAWKKAYSSSPAPSQAEEFLGMIRINLKTIPELLQNPFAFASNLFPTILVDGSMPIWDPATDKNVAVADITFAVGTVQQIHLFDQKRKTVVQTTQQQQNPQFTLKPNSEENQPNLPPFQPKNTKNITVVEDNDDDSSTLVKNQQRIFLLGQQIQTNQPQNQQTPENSKIYPQDRIKQNKSGNENQYQQQQEFEPIEMLRFEGIEYSKEVINKVFVIIMENIRRNKRRAQNILRNFILKAEKHEKRVTIREFYDFLNDIPVQEALKVKNGYIHKLVAVLDYEQAGEILTTEFIKSYNSFLNYEDILRDSYSSAIKEFAQLLASKSLTTADFERILYRQSEFGFVRREILKQFLEKDLECENLLISRLVDLLDTAEDGLIQANLLPDYLRSLEVYEHINYISCDYKRYSDLVKQNLQENLTKNEESVQELLLNDELADKELTVRDIQYLVQGLGLDISFWESLCIIESIRLQLGIPANDPHEEFKLPFVYFADWLGFVMKQKKEDPQFNYFSYLVEQRNRILDENLYNAHLLKNNLESNRSDNSALQQESSQRNKVHGGRNQQQNDEDELIQLIKANYKP